MEINNMGLKEKAMGLKEKSKNIKLVISDLDGTLTDGIYQVSEDNKVIKSFFTRDFHYIGKLLDCGIAFLILTKANDDCGVMQYKRLPYMRNDLFFIKSGASDKSSYIEQNLVNSNNMNPFDCVADDSNLTASTIIKCNPFINDNAITWDSIAYIGDADNDLASMKLAAITGCPADAEDAVKNESNFISICPGGRGAVADFIKYLLMLRDVSGKPPIA
ncbi:MAG: hypothetical protein WDA06_00450 [Phenylobacterium sp.]